MSWPLRGSRRPIAVPTVEVRSPSLPHGTLHAPASTAQQVEQELSDICTSILQLLDEHLIPTASSGESKVFYLKMKGDYHRYLAEFKTGADRKEAAEHTLLAYKAAQVCVMCAFGAVCRLWGRYAGSVIQYLQVPWTHAWTHTLGQLSAFGSLSSVLHCMW